MTEKTDTQKLHELQDLCCKMIDAWFDWYYCDGKLLALSNAVLAMEDKAGYYEYCEARRD